MKYGLSILLISIAVFIAVNGNKEEPEITQMEQKVDPLVDEQLKQLREAEHKKTQERLARLQLEQEKADLMSVAAEQTPDFRDKILSSSRVTGNWQSFLKQRKAEYKALYKRALKNPEEQIECSICKGSAYTDTCVVCTDSNGLCLTCKGKGKYLNEYCPTCQGSGNCFKCSGDGSMVCPYCDCGTINITYPHPPSQLSQ